MTKMNHFVAASLLLILTACGGGSPDSPKSPTKQEIAIAKIAAYAKDSEKAPTIEDYLNAGVVGVGTDNLDEINAVVLGLTEEEVDTKEEVQALLDNLGIHIEKDTIPPVISLKGKNPYKATIGDVYIEEGATAIDAIDGACTVTITGDVDMSTAGRYILTYHSRDTSGNHADVTRTIIVVAPLENIASVKQTGAIESYDIDGKKVTDGSLKDDGYYQFGVKTEYATAQDESIIIDNISNLTWTMEDKQDLENVGDAIYYCEHLSLAGYADWRVPSALELLDIVDYPFYTLSSYTNRKHNERGDWWVSTTYEKSGDYKSYYHFNILSGRMDKRGNGSYGNVKCVRGTPLNKEEFTRDDNSEIVTTSKSHLAWQDNSDVVHYQHTWNEAIEYCEALSLGEYEDWRLPTKKELVSLIEYAQIDTDRASGLMKTFKSRGDNKHYFYSSTSYLIDEKYHKYKEAVNTFNGTMRADTGVTKNMVRCVRNVGP